MTTAAAVAALMCELHEVIERVVALDAGTLAADDLHALTMGLQIERNRLAVGGVAVAAEWQTRGAWAADGSLNAGLAMARDTHGCHRQARHELRRGRRLADMPHVRAAILDGRLSLDHLDLFLQVATPERIEQFALDEAVLVTLCEGLCLFDDCRKALRYWAQRFDDEMGRGRADTPDPSTLYWSRGSVTGEGVLRGVLSPIDAEIVDRELRRLTALERQLDREAGVQRTPAQRRAAALVRMASRSVNAEGATARPLFQVIVGDDTARHLCELSSGHVVHPTDLEPFIDAALLETFLFDGPSTVIAKSHLRTFTGALRAAIKVRDRRCQHRSGCPASADDADIDHRHPWAQGGQTSQFNGRVECVPHNRLEHLHDPCEPGELGMPERDVTALDALRCRVRWLVLHHPQWQYESSHVETQAAAPVGT